MQNSVITPIPMPSVFLTVVVRPNKWLNRHKNRLSGNRYFQPFGLSSQHDGRASDVFNDYNLLEDAMMRVADEVRQAASTAAIKVYLGFEVDFSVFGMVPLFWEIAQETQCRLLYRFFPLSAQSGRKPDWKYIFVQSASTLVHRRRN